MQGCSFFWIGDLIMYSNLDGIPLRNSERRVEIS